MEDKLIDYLIQKIDLKDPISWITLVIVIGLIYLKNRRKKKCPEENKEK